MIIANNDINRKMEFYTAYLSSTVLLPVGYLFNKVPFYDASDTSVGTNDAGLSASPDGIVADYVMPECVDIGNFAVVPLVIFCCTDTDAYIFSISNGAILNDPAITEVGTYRTFLKRIRRRPVCSRMPDIEAVNNDVLGGFSHFHVPFRPDAVFWSVGSYSGNLLL